MLGMCYILDPDLTLPRNDDLGSKNILVVRDALGGKKLKAKQFFDDHAKWGVCQVGTAAAFVKPEDISPEDGDDDLALFGAPGCFTWRGNLFGQKVGTLKRYDMAVNENTLRSYSKHGHMGLSVTSGRFFDGKVYYVSGAPHAGTGETGSRTGEIYFFEKDPANNLFQPNWDFTLRGETFGSGFGYSLATLDANGDSKPDLLVGAPFHDGGKTGKGGAVYLYLSKKGSLDSESYVKIIGSQLESQFGLALSALGDLNKDGFEDFGVGAPYENKGGAVYIFFGGPKGLRLHGPSATFLSADEVADQIIRGDDLSSTIRELPADLRTFGSSLSGGGDMDGNGYPDLLVGAYQSNYVFLLRSRPVIDITTSVDETNLKGIDPGQSGCLEDLDAEESCFGFKACFSVDKEVSEQGLKLKFVIKAEPKKPVSRVWLRLDSDEERREGEKNSRLEDTITIQNGHRQEYCTKIVGYVGTHSDFQTPVEFSMSYSLIQEEPSMVYREGYPMPDMDNYPILNQAQAKKRFQATFEKDCGDDDICQSQLELVPTLRDISKELGKTPGGYYELELGSLNGSELVLDIVVNNLGEAAYEATLDVFFPSAINYIGLGQGTKLNAPELKNNTWLEFNLGNPFKGIDEGVPNSSQIQLRFSPKKDMGDKLIQFYLAANTSSQQVVDASTFVNLVIVRRAEIKVVGRGFPEEVHYGGQIKGESAMSELGEIGPQVVHKFQVINDGPSSVDVLTVDISWPFQVENGKRQGKWLLYLVDHPLLKNGRGDCVLPPGYRANPLNLTTVHNGIIARHAPDMPHNVVYKESDFTERYTSESAGDTLEDQDLRSMMRSLTSRERPRKAKREVEQVILPHIIKDELGKDMKVVTLDCDRGSAKCLKVTCQIYNLPAKMPATIEIRSRVWNSTLAEDYADVDFVEIFAKAKVVVDPDITQDISDDYESVRTTAYLSSHKLTVESQIDWWVILISILLGLLLLVIISLILWKFGFFKRKRPLEEEDDDFLMSAHFEKVHLNGSTST